MRSIRRQLNGVLIAAIAVIEGAGLTTTYLFLRRSLTSQLDDLLLTKAQAISTLTLRDGEQVRVAFSDRFMHGFDEDEGTDFFEMWRGDGPPIARSESLVSVELPRTTGTLQKPRFWSLTLPDNRPGRAVGVEFSPRSATREKKDAATRAPDLVLQLVVASDRTRLDDELGELLAVIVGAGVLVLGATALIVPAALRRGLRPLDALALQAGGISAQSLSDRFQTAKVPAELQPITLGLNDLLTRLEASFERERRVSADLAHELRTPLAELRMVAESALKWPESRDPASDRETLAIATQMERIVQMMLTLARAENGQILPRKEPVAMAALIEAAWKPFAARAAQNDIRVDFELQPFTATTDPSVWRAVLSNLFDNAVEYTPKGGAVRVRCSALGGEGRVAVANDTDGLTPADAASFFERFWRKESARSGGQHLGLGLSLVRGFSAALGWTASCVLDERRVLTMELRGPFS